RKVRSRERRSEECHRVSGEGIRPRFSSRRFTRPAEGIPAGRKPDPSCAHCRKAADRTQRSRGTVSAGGRLRPPRSVSRGARRLYAACRSPAGDRLDQAAEQPAYHDHLRARRFGRTGRALASAEQSRREHVNEVTELLAHASVKDGNLARARDLYQMLATTEPQNQLHQQNYRQVMARMEEASPSIGITAEEGAVIVEELEAIAPVIDQAYPDDIAIALRSAVTDADLFLSYNLPDKAVVPLLGALPQVPRDARLNQRL